MAKGIYVSATTPGSGKSLIALGLADTLHRHADRIGFFKPVVNGHDAASDPMVALMKARFDLDDDRCRGGLTFAEVRSLLAEGNREEIDSRCVEIFAEMARHCDVVIVEGTDLTGQDAAVEFDLNARLANNLAAPVVAVVGAKGRTVAEAADAVEVARKELVAERCTLLAIMVNRADPEDVDGHRRRGAARRLRPSRVRPARSWRRSPGPPPARWPRPWASARWPACADLERDVRSMKVAAMSVANFLHVLDDGALVIVPGDRADVLVACLASSFSPEFPVPSALILTGGLAPDPNIYSLLAQAPFPVFAAPDDTYVTAKRVSEVRSEIWSGHRRKVASALGLWARRVDEAELLERLHLPRLERMTPLRFLHDLIERARPQRRHIVLPEGNGRPDPAGRGDPAPPRRLRPDHPGPRIRRPRARVHPGHRPHRHQHHGPGHLGAAPAVRARSTRSCARTRAWTWPRPWRSCWTAATSAP